jgi:hypothetical protein
VLLIQDISTIRKETLGSTETIATTKLHGVTYWKNRILIRHYYLFNAHTSTLAATADRRVAKQQTLISFASSDSQVQHLTPFEHQAALALPGGKNVQLLQTFHTAKALVENSCITHHLQIFTRNDCT